MAKAAPQPVPGGGELRRMFCLASCRLLYSDCREFVADQSGAPGDGSLSLGWNRIGAVPTVAFARPCCATGPGLAFPDAFHTGDKVSSPRILEVSARCVQLLRCQRFSRLCVLMNPILPGSRSIRTWPAIALFQLRSPESIKASGCCRMQKPPCTMQKKPLKLENRSKCLKLGLLRAGQFRGTQEVIL